jgi:hypothetical protein
MLKETFTINYKGSGIKTTRLTADILFFLCILSAIGFIMATAGTEDPLFLLYAALSLVAGFIFFGSLRALATIAENSLIQRTKVLIELKNNFYIEEKK